MLSLAREDAGRSLDRRTVAVDDLLDDLRRDLPLFGPREYEVGTLGARSKRIPTASPRSCATSPGMRSPIRRRAATSRFGPGPRAISFGIEVIDDGPGIPPEEAAHCSSASIVPLRHGRAIGTVGAGPCDRPRHRRGSWWSDLGRHGTDARCATGRRATGLPPLRRGRGRDRPRPRRVVSKRETAPCWSPGGAGRRRRRRRPESPGRRG